MPPKWMDFLWFSPARVCPGHHFFQESRVWKCPKDSDKIFHCLSFTVSKWQPPTCWKKTSKAGVAAASVASEKMKEKAAATGTQKLGFVFWKWCFFYLFTKVTITIKPACVYVCSLGFVVCFFYWFYPMVNHHHEANHHLKGEYVWFTFSKDLKSKPKGSKNCLIFCSSPANVYPKEKIARACGRYSLLKVNLGWVCWFTWICLKVTFYSLPWQNTIKKPTNLG